MQAAGCPQDRFEQHLALNLQTAGFLSIDGGWFINDLRRHHPGRRFFGGMRPDGGGSRNIGIAEAALLYFLQGRVGVGVSDGGAVAKARTRYYARYALGAAAAIAIARSGGQIEGSFSCDVDRLALVGFGGNSIRIAEASGLHLGG